MNSDPLIRCQPLNADCEIAVLEGPLVLSPAIQARIDSLWLEQKKLRGDSLFDGPVLSLVEARPQRLTLRWTSYRYLLASMKAPELPDVLAIKPLGVTAILTCPDGIILGRRSNAVAVMGGRWEGAPSGTLTDIDPAKLILEELEEELGLARGRVTRPVMIALAEDVKYGVTDILLRLTTEASAAEIQGAFDRVGTDEYSEIAIVPEAKLAAFLEELAGNFVPILPSTLRLAGLMR